jgi:glycosyltransferase involved in cell wall biosynthesis
MCKLLSIIVPAYNVAPYIEKCIRSLENQDISKEDYEIIVVNDGSPDNCKEIVEGLQKEFANITLINQENQGVSMARNNAIAIAKGTYILPIDPDDYVLPNTFKQILNRITTQNFDVLYLGFEIFDLDGNSVWKTNYSEQEKKRYTGEEAYFAGRGSKVRNPDRSWAMLYRRELLNHFDITYPKDVPYLEDGLFLGKVFTVATLVGFDNSSFYQRTTRRGSATNSNLFFSEYAMRGFILSVKDIKQFAASQPLKQEQLHVVNHVVAKFVFLAISPSIFTFKFGQYSKVLKILKKENLYKLNVMGVRLLFKDYIRVYNFSKLLFPIYIHIRKRISIYFK